jgi:hypothetical protein
MKPAYVVAGIGLALIAMWWFTWASPQARVARAQAAKLDTAAAFAAFQDSAQRSYMPLLQASNRFFDARQAMPSTRAHYLRYGVDSSRFQETTSRQERGYIRTFVYHSSVRTPKAFRTLYGTADSLDVITVVQNGESPLYSVSVSVAGRLWSCQTGRQLVGMTCGWLY